MAQEQVEEYLEAIYDIAGPEGAAKTSAIAKCLKVAPASVTEALQNLSEKNLVNYEPYKGASLTGDGRKIAEDHQAPAPAARGLFWPMSCISAARKCTTRHAGWSTRYPRIPRTPSAGCSMPLPAAPTGARSPPCSKGIGSCSECDANVGSAFPVPADLRTSDILPLTTLEHDQKGKIAFIRGDCKVVQRLSDLGLTLGTTVSVTRRAPMNGPVEVFVRRTKLAIDHAIAENIFVDTHKGGNV